MASFIKLIVSFLYLKFKPRRRKGQKTVLLMFQSPQYYGTHTYFRYITEYLTQRGVKIHLLVAESEVDEKVRRIVEMYKISMMVYNNKDIYPITYHEGQSLKGAYYFIYHALMQSVFVLRVYRRVNPLFTVVSVGWPFMWFPAFMVPGKIFGIFHVMPMVPLERGNAAFMKAGLLFKSSRLIAVSDFCRKKMALNWRLPIHKIDVVYNYYEGIEKARITSDKIRVVSIARADDVKNPALWAQIGNRITAMRDNVVFVWAGEGNNLQAARGKVLDQTKVQFLGYRTDVPELYANADIYFTPARSETHGIAVVEAMFYGLPVIATNNGGTVESVAEGETGFLVDVSNEEQMIARLLQLVDDETLRIEMGRKGRLRYEQLFTKETWIRHMDSLMKE